MPSTKYFKIKFCKEYYQKIKDSNFILDAKYLIDCIMNASI